MPDPTFGQADTGDATLENFFSRPVKIATYQWAVGTTLFETFNPWQLYYENARVINRIANFNLLRSKLKVRIMLNGNGFYYGRAIASYTPLHTEDEFTQDRAFFTQDVVAASQRPHVYIDPTSSQGGTLTLPFFWYKNALNIPKAEWREMGDMHIHQLQGLKHANGSIDPITISIFAWAEDVTMSIPTQADPLGLVPQSGKAPKQKKDEYGDGIVSRPAAVVAKVAGQLSNIPVIGPYARATQMAAGAVSGIAKLFGYSRPVMTETSIPFSPHLVGNIANTNVPDQSTKLTLDLKQELCVDPKTMGLGNTDEMSIKNIATRESYLTSFAWNLSSPVDSLLWNCEVTPVIWDELNTEIHMPACCFATLPFKRWRGTMKYRFQIVASAFHKGRLRISYDPYITGIGEYNTQYVHIVDLAKERDFTIEVGWGHELGSLNHKLPGAQPIPHSIFPFPIDTLNNRNGVLSVRVVNDLTSPSNAVLNDVAVNVFVSTGDDIAVWEPDADVLQPYTYINPVEPAAAAVPLPQEREEVLGPQAGVEVADGSPNQPDSDLTSAEDEPMKPDPSHLLAPVPTHDECFDLVYYGDPITSIRQVLKRYTLHRFECKAFQPNAFSRIRSSNFPSYRGYDPNGTEATSTSTPFNYCNMTYLNYVTPAYTARRGGIRWKWIRTCSNDNYANIAMFLERESSSGGGSDQQTLNISTVNNSTRSFRTAQYLNQSPLLFDGAVATLSAQNQVCEFELPYYNFARFSPAKRRNQNQNNSIFNQFYRMYLIWSSSGSMSPAFAQLVSTGEDFSLNFFTGAPVIYYSPLAVNPPPDN